ncbi:lysis protein [Klebsiella pneumoniae]|uniref:lysis protein n=1 Tax=Klebsiella pneumoniae TaxID=573 RepID=UPI0035BFB9DC
MLEETMSTLKDLSRQLKQLQKQIPFATAQAMTSVVRDIAAAQKVALGRKLESPTPFTVNSVGSAGARKNNLRAKVFVRDVAALDAKYTKDLADAKKQLDDLQRCVSNGKCGLRINAKCPSNGATSSGGLGDASGPRLTDSAERDYFTLRERIATVTKQVGYLQDYIKEQCLK